MITLDNVSISRGGRVIITDLSEVIPKGTISVIMGANGSGKSTLLAGISGHIALDKGRIKINDIDISKTSARKLSEIRAMAIQSQGFSLGFTVRQVVEMAGPADEALKSLDLLDISQARVTSLSGGQSQRVALAQVLAQSSPVLLLDEPLASQDIESRERIIKILKEYVGKGGTVVMASHSDESELIWADKVIKLK